jgi:hypothetical protein
MLATKNTAQMISSARNRPRPFLACQRISGSGSSFFAKYGISERMPR